MTVPLLYETTFLVAQHAAIGNLLRWQFFMGIVYGIRMASYTIWFVSIPAGGNFFATMNTFIVGVDDCFVAERFSCSRVLDGMALC